MEWLDAEGEVRRVTRGTGELGGIAYQANPVIGADARTIRLHVPAGDQPMARNRVRLARERDTASAATYVTD